MSTGKRILVIDDDNAVRGTICENLRDAGFDVLEAANGLHGLAMIEGYGIPDVVITDIIMPEMGGIEAIEEIRKKNSGVNIIAISGGGRTDTEDFLETAQKRGADAVFSKPIDMDKLEDLINRLVA